MLITVADAAGNTASCTATVTVEGKTTKSDMEKMEYSKGSCFEASTPFALVFTNVDC